MAMGKQTTGLPAALEKMGFIAVSVLHPACALSSPCLEPADGLSGNFAIQHAKILHERPGPLPFATCQKPGPHQPGGRHGRQSMDCTIRCHSLRPESTIGVPGAGQACAPAALATSTGPPSWYPRAGWRALHTGAAACLCDGCLGWIHAMQKFTGICPALSALHRQARQRCHHRLGRPSQVGL